MSCKYCEKRYETPVKEMEHNAYLWVEKDNECLTVPIAGGDLTFLVNYCPMCGEELNKASVIKNE